MEVVKFIIDYSGNNYCAGAEDYACVTVGRSMEELKENIAEAIEFHFEGMREDNEVCPSKDDYTLTYEYSVAALLQHYKSILPLAALSKVTGINQGLLSHYISGLRTPREKQRTKIINGFHTIAKELASIS